MSDYRKIYSDKHGDPPYRCEYCGEEVADDIVIHHADEDRSNNDLSNLQAMHRACHTIHHWTGKEHKPETKKKYSEMRRGRPMGEAQRAGLLRANTGRVVSAETKAKISASLKGHPVSDEARAKMRAAALARNTSGGAEH